MKVPLWIVFLSFSVAIFCENSSNETDDDADAFSGYELIQYRLDFLQDRIGRALDQLTTQVEALKENMIANISGSIDALENVMTHTRNITEEKLAVLKEDNSKISNKIGNLETKLIANNSRLLERITKLESLGANVLQNQKAIDEQLKIVQSNVSVVANHTKTMFEKLIPKITSCGMAKKSGLFTLQSLNITVLCENDLLNGGWLVIQQRINLNLNFSRNWKDYRIGFGIIGEYKDFWLGNEAIHHITNSGYYELLFELKTRTETFHVRYSKFRIAGEVDKYRLTVGGYSGSLQDNFSANNNVSFAARGKASCFGTYYWWLKEKCKASSDINASPGPYWYPQFYSGSRMMIRRKYSFV